MNIFLFHRDLRIHDNSALNHQIRELARGGETITPIFIFPPEQINPAKNPYFSHNSVQFMVESCPIYPLKFGRSVISAVTTSMFSNACIVRAK